MTGSIDAAHLQPDNEAIQLPAPQLVDQLRILLGARLVAYIAGADATTTVTTWAAGTKDPPPDAMTKLRTAYRAASIISNRAGSGMVGSWLQGMSPLLGDRSPARVLREEAAERDHDQVLRAAAAFAGI